MAKNTTPRAPRIVRGVKPADTLTPADTQVAAPADAPADTQVAQVAAPVGPVRFMRSPQNHTLSGGRLLSHTVAFIQCTTGFRPGVAMPQWRDIVGQSAYAYHKAKGNIAVGPTGAPVLTEAGAAFFQGRKGNEVALIATFATMFQTGELPAGMMGENHPPIKISK